MIGEALVVHADDRNILGIQSSVHELVHQTNGEISFFLVLERSSSNCSGQFSSNVDEQVGMVDLEAVHDRHSLLDGNSTDEV